MESQAIADRVSSGISARREKDREAGGTGGWGRRSIEDLRPGIRADVKRLRDVEGKSWTDIARELEVGRTTVRELYVIPPGEKRPPPSKKGVSDAS